MPGNPKKPNGKARAAAKRSKAPAHLSEEATEAEKLPRAGKSKFAAHSSEFRDKALAALVESGGNLTKTARQLKVDARTLRKWWNASQAAASQPVEATPAAELTERDVRAKLTSIANAALDFMPHKLAGAPLNQITAAAGFAIDALKSLEGERPNGDAPLVPLWKMTDEQLEQLERLTAYLLHHPSGGVDDERRDPGHPESAASSAIAATGMELSLSRASLRIHRLAFGH